MNNNVIEDKNEDHHVQRIVLSILVAVTLLAISAAIIVNLFVNNDNKNTVIPYVPTVLGVYRDEASRFEFQYPSEMLVQMPTKEAFLPDSSVLYEGVKFIGKDRVALLGTNNCFEFSTSGVCSVENERGISVAVFDSDLISKQFKAAETITIEDHSVLYYREIVGFQGADYYAIQLPNEKSLIIKSPYNPISSLGDIYALFSVDMISTLKTF